MYIGKDIYPINLPQMKSINSHAWQKASSFDTLFDTVSNSVDANSVADVISLVSTELPIDTSAAYQEAQSASKGILDSVLKISNLEPLAFSNSTGATMSMINFSDLEKRPADITFVKFRCNMNVATVDSRVVSAPKLSFIFCLKLPLYEYDSLTKIVTRLDTSSVPASITNVARSLSSCFAASGMGTPSSGTSSTPSGNSSATTA